MNYLTIARGVIVRHSRKKDGGGGSGGRRARTSDGQPSMWHVWLVDQGHRSPINRGGVIREAAAMPLRRHAHDGAEEIREVKVKPTLDTIQSELLEVLERVMGLIEKVEQLDGDEVGTSPRARAEKASGSIMSPAEGVRQVGARSDKPASPPTSSPPKHPWRQAPSKPAQPVIPLGKKPEIPAILPECPCVNPEILTCRIVAPAGIHTRGTGAAAQYSRCRFYEVRMAVENKPKERFNGSPDMIPRSGNGMPKKRCPGYDGNACSKWITWKSQRCQQCHSGFVRSGRAA